MNTIHLPLLFIAFITLQKFYVRYICTLFCTKDIQLDIETILIFQQPMNYFHNLYAKLHKIFLNHIIQTVCSSLRLFKTRYIQAVSLPLIFESNLR